MKAEDQQQLFGEIKALLAGTPLATFGIIGLTPTSFDLVAFFRAIGAESRLVGIYSGPNALSNAEKPMASLSQDRPAAVIIASDEKKEELINQALPYLAPATKILLGGY